MCGTFALSEEKKIGLPLWAVVYDYDFQSLSPAMQPACCNCTSSVRPKTARTKLCHKDVLQLSLPRLVPRSLKSTLKLNCRELFRFNPSAQKCSVTFEYFLSLALFPLQLHVRVTRCSMQMSLCSPTPYYNCFYAWVPCGKWNFVPFIARGGTLGGTSIPLN